VGELVHFFGENIRGVKNNTKVNHNMLLRLMDYFGVIKQAGESIEMETGHLKAY
jgi:hypothetical protein